MNHDVTFKGIGSDVRTSDEQNLDRSRAVAGLHLERSRGGKAAGQIYEYDINISWGALVGTTLSITFVGKHVTFNGWAVGSAAGGFVGWGSAALNFPIEELVGWEASFAVEGAGVGGGGIGVQLWAMDGRYIGDASAGGVGIGGCFGGGQGEFKG